MNVTITIDYKRCKQCGICRYFCPKKVFDAKDDGSPLAARSEDCIACMQCVKRCPDFAIEVVKGENHE